MSKLIKNSIIYTIGNISPQIISYLLLPIYTRYLTPSDYGIISAMAALQTVLLIIFTLCLERSIYRLYFDYPGIDSKRNFLGTIFLSYILYAFFITIALFILHKYISLIYKSINFFPYYSYTILTTYFTLFSLLPLIYFQVTENARGYVLTSFGQFLLQIGLIIWFVVGQKGGAEGQIKARFLAAILMTPIYTYITLKCINLNLKKDILKSALKFSLPMVPSLISAWILNLSNRIFIEKFISLTDVGIYSLGHQLGTAAVAIGGGIYFAYVPYFYKTANDTTTTDEHKKSKLSQSHNLYILILLSIVFIVSLFYRELVLYFLDKRYLDSYYIARLIAYSYFFSSITSIASLSITQVKKTKQDMLIAVSMALLNLLLNWWLIPLYGMPGAIISSFITFTTAYVITYNYSKKCYFIPVKWNTIGPIIFFSLIIVISYHYLIENRYPVLSIISKLLISAITGIFVFKNVKKISDLKLLQS